MLTSIPSPTTGAWHLGPLTVHAYALCILSGIVLAVWLTGRRLAQRGHPAERSLDIAGWAVPFGIVGGRLWHVITSPQAYFGEGGHPLDALKVWQGGLGIWGAVALGAVGAWFGCRRTGVPFLHYLDAAAPGVAFAHALGRWGNWFNNELYGPRTDLPWGLVIHQWDAADGRAVVDAAGKPVVLGTYHPTFLYEFAFLVLIGAGLLLGERRRRAAGRPLADGMIFATYVMAYPVGRVVMEFMRTDPANRILGLRVNVWTCLVTFIFGLVLLLRARARGSREADGEQLADPAETGPVAS